MPGCIGVGISTPMSGGHPGSLAAVEDTEIRPVPFSVPISLRSVPIGLGSVRFHGYAGPTHGATPSLKSDGAEPQDVNKYYPIVDKDGLLKVGRPVGADDSPHHCVARQRGEMLKTLTPSCLD
ncbi:hypothetical protein IMZ48_27840 [Candidatus Bathyarchaeota archaeon]|nr:hypothetical protein [Candidatus Bathyarchaeota archaeon]